MAVEEEKKYIKLMWCFDSSNKNSKFESETTTVGLFLGCYLSVNTLHKKWSFPLRISLVNVTKSVVSCGLGHIYRRNS